MFKIFDVSGSALSAQLVRLNATASNLANADSVSTTQEGVYKAKNPVFKATYDSFMDDSISGVQVAGMMTSQAEGRREYAPNNPLADGEGYIYSSNVNSIEEMTNMLSASRSYQNNVEVLNTVKQLISRTLTLGQGR